ncbi:MAG TPA: VWA domain-containing protein [Terracidiphilus sp.]|jgi:VWFA-related protein|nr:VWA domain-containing protein [Terracidiphilus sp.]
MATPHISIRGIFPARRALLLVAAALLVSAPAYSAQDQTQPSGQQPKQQDQTAPDAGGPSGDNGVIALPKKKESTDEPPPAPAAPPEPKFKNPEGMGNVSIRVDVPEVTVDVGVLLEKTGQFVPGLKPENFRIYEDGVEQKIEGFKRVEAPITALLLCEYAARGWVFRMDMLNAAWAFTQQLRPQDYVAMMTFDMRSHIEVDFTQDKRQIQEAINELGNSVFMPAAFSETNVFDALYESMDRLDRIQGRKYIILIASGIDSMSKLTFDKILKRVKESQNITIYAISTGGLLREMTEGQGGMMASMRDMDYLQADNEMRTFAQLTGGMWFEPKFTGELPDMVSTINQNIRAKYQLVYHPTNAKQDGTYRKLRVVLVDSEGQPLRMQDQKHKPLKYDIEARDGYRAKQEVE